jgi:putative ABC transport system permease protein
MALAVLACYAAAARPARAIARVPVVAALSGRPPVPKAVRHLAVPFGLGFGTLAFFLLGMAGSGIGTSGSGNSRAQPQEVLLGFITLVIAVVLLSPACLAVLARLGRWMPVMVRLALRDLARYRARSGPALAAISLSVLIASIVSVVAAARFGDAIDWVGPNLTSSQLLVNPPGHDNPHGPPRPRPRGASPPPLMTVTQSRSRHLAAACSMADQGEAGTAPPMSRPRNC